MGKPVMKKLIVTDGALWGGVTGVLIGFFTGINVMPLILMWALFGVVAGITYVTGWEKMVGEIE